MPVLFAYRSFAYDWIRENLTHDVEFTRSASVWSLEREIHLVFRNGNTIPHGIFRIPIPFPILFLGRKIPYSNSQSSHCSLKFHIPNFNPLIAFWNSTFQISIHASLFCIPHSKFQSIFFATVIQNAFHIPEIGGFRTLLVTLHLHTFSAWNDAF